MLESSKVKWFYAICAAFIVLLGFALIFEHFEFLLLPAVLLIVYLAIFKLDTLYLFLLAMVAPSVNIPDIGVGFGLTLPTDPILAGMLLLFLFKIIYNNELNKEVMLHPISIMLYIQLAWVFITSLTSTMPGVSIKYLTAQLWYITSFYFIATHVFFNFKNINRFFWLNILPFAVIIGYTLVNHAKHHFDQESGNWVMKPFYNDHTSYGAALAMFLPFLLAKTFEFNLKNTLIKPLIFMVLLYFIAATIFSYTRAAWLSLAFGMVVYIILKFKIRWTVIAAGILTLIITALVFQNDISNYFAKNKQNSSTDINQHVKSISNVSSDASNKERINRWKSGYAMFLERPVFGWGPGTYSFNYGRFQKERDKTIISTNSGDMGNAHSEYIGPLSEGGLPAMLIVFALFGTILITGVRVYKKSENKFFKTYSMVCIIGLVTYMIHGFLNNFLDTDKITAPFYGMTGILIVMDLYQKKKMPEQDLKSELKKVL